MTDLERAILHIKTRADAWAVREVEKALSQEPCNDVIKAVLDGIDELKKSPWATDKRGNGFEYLITEALDVVAELCVKQLPPVTHKSGKWIAVYQGDEIINYRCSECELGDTNGSTNLYGWDYCRRCGAKMESEDKE